MDFEIQFCFILSEMLTYNMPRMNLLQYKKRDFVKYLDV